MLRFLLNIIKSPIKPLKLFFILSSFNKSSSHPKYILKLSVFIIFNFISSPEQIVGLYSFLFKF